MQWMIILTVTCWFVSVCQCAELSSSELEEFNDFLQKTSQLDQILQKGNDIEHDFDEDELISDHAWEVSGKFEGDLILNERQRRVIVKDVTEGLARNGLIDSTKKWPNNEVIFYIQKEHFSVGQLQAIQDGIEDLGRASCIKFRPYIKGDRDAVVIQGSRRGCFSQVGYQGGYQVLNLSGRHPVGKGCFRHGTVVHELLHTLGFFHMQSSPDRDDYIKVNWDNIVQPARHNFRKYSTFDVSDFGVGYDYDSVLHYSRKAFSSNGRDTLEPKQNGASIGQRVGLSDKDTQKLNKMYCDAESNSFDEEENPIQKPIVTRKKSPKNKPFEGHGIGYHQGKTIVIKLPTAKTIKLSNVLPTMHLFDYFSKAPETVSSTVTEGFGTRQEVKDLYKPPVLDNSDDDYDDFLPSLSLRGKYDNSHDKEEEIVTHSDEIEKPTVYFTKDLSSEFQENGKISSIIANDDISEAFDRLGKIIMTHVTPSHTPNFSAYQKKYSDFFTPTKNFKPEPEIEKVEKSFYSSQPARLPLLESSRRPTLSNSNENRTSEETDSSYGTNYPFRNKYVGHEKSKYSIDNTNSTKLKDALAVKNDGIFGYFVPLYGRFHKNDVFTIKPNEYIQDPHINADYTNVEKGDKIDESLTDDDKHSDYTDEENPNRYISSVSVKQPYKIFGALVPLTNKWYKRDYEPPKYKFPLDRTNSREVSS